jgi:hypothetical protein
VKTKKGETLKSKEIVQDADAFAAEYLACFFEVLYVKSASKKSILEQI